MLPTVFFTQNSPIFELVPGYAGSPKGL